MVTREKHAPKPWLFPFPSSSFDRPRLAGRSSQLAGSARRAALPPAPYSRPWNTQPHPTEWLGIRSVRGRMGLTHRIRSRRSAMGAVRRSCRRSPWRSGESPGRPPRQGVSRDSLSAFDCSGHCNQGMAGHLWCERPNRCECPVDLGDRSILLWPAGAIWSPCGPGAPTMPASIPPIDSSRGSRDDADQTRRRHSAEGIGPPQPCLSSARARLWYCW